MLRATQPNAGAACCFCRLTPIRTRSATAMRSDVRARPKFHEADTRRTYPSAGRKPERVSVKDAMVSFGTPVNSSGQLSARLSV